jgi:hypothetical protein
LQPSQHDRHKLNRVIARALFVFACVGLASLAHATTLYSDKTDRELTELAAGWEGLTEEQRRALLTEIKSRMHASADKHPVLKIQTERRYGRIVRQPDGSLVRIETTEHVVRFQALPEDAGDRPFGLGFEQRVVAGGAPESANEAARPAPPLNPPPAQAPVIQVGNAHDR